MRSQNPLFRRFSRLNPLGVVDMALSELENNIHLSRNSPHALMRRVGEAMQKKLKSCQTAPDECHRIIRRALSSDSAGGYICVADMLLDLHRARAQVEAQMARLKTAQAEQRLQIKQARAARPSVAERLHRPLVRISAVLTVVALLFCGGVALHYLYPNGIFLTEVEVPLLVGQNIKQTVPDQDLFVLDVTYQFCNDAKTGTVLSQSPTAGMTRRVSPGQHPCTISLLVSLGPAQVQVGDYVGMTKYQAMSECRRLGLIPTFKSAKDHPSGNVASSDPPAGTVLSKGSTIVLYVGTAAKVTKVVVPNLVDNNEVGATTMLSSLGLACGGVSYLKSDRPAGTVIAQSILSGTSVNHGTKVSLVVSKGNA